MAGELALAECSTVQIQEYFRLKSKESFYGDEFDHLFLPGMVHQVERSSGNESSAPSPQPNEFPAEDRWILDTPVDAANLRRMASHAARVGFFLVPTAADEQAGCRPRA